MSHTKEPWGYSEQPVKSNGFYITADGIFIGESGGGPQQLKEVEANAKRICDCVNAMAGIANPEGFVNSVKADMEEEEAFNRKAEQAIKETEDARAYLIAQGLNPDEVGKQGATFVRVLSEKMRLEEQLKEVTGQRDQAWKDNKEIREMLEADENESTVDEVQSLLLNYRRAKDQMYKVRELLDGCADEFTELLSIVRPGE